MVATTAGIRTDQRATASLAVVPKTLIVNPAFLQEIKDSNPDFWSTLHQLRQLCNCNEEPKQVASRLVMLLDQFRDAIAMQFALEECYGYLQVPTAVNHHASEIAEQTRAQHCSLYLQLSALAELAEEFQYRGILIAQLPNLIQQTLQFDSAFREHEQKENELIEISFGVF